MNQQRFTTVGLAALLALSVPALADFPSAAPVSDMTMGVNAPAESVSPPPSGLTTLGFDTIDKDANGQLTREEFEAQGMTESLFTTIDTDRDGYLSRTEIDAHGPLIHPVQ